MTGDTNLNLLIENAIFFLIATSFLTITGWMWRNSEPYSLPETLPSWFKIWFGTVQILGGVLPIVALIFWGFWWGYSSTFTVLIPYLVMLLLQILSEIISLRQFHSVVWVMVPYLYVPYRVWQLYEGLTILPPENELIWIRYLLFVNIVVWIGNYCLDLAQLPFLLRWKNWDNNQENF
ncbi:MAG: hypothetical protein SAJ37_21110 [Oscillatoria sp. PMC 1068.18]|nr:hypothetical protein [Oscillatoria sp. PMC 1076.18]MEC4991242.1 hypothetical protein [Oscillatoria sp. PMC 1068.18]